jgi:hypothetical protein
VKARRFELLEEIHDLDCIEAAAHAGGPDKPEVWEALACVYGRRPAAIAELSFIENAQDEKVSLLLGATEEQRQAVCQAILEYGGLFDCDGRFIEVR